MTWLSNNTFILSMIGMAFLFAVLCFVLQHYQDKDIIKRKDIPMIDNAALLKAFRDMEDKDGESA